MQNNYQQDVINLIRETLETQFDPQHPECVLRNDFHKPHLKTKFYQCLNIDILIDFTLTCLDIINEILILRQQDKPSPEFQLQYWQIFSQLPQPKDEMIAFILIVVWQLIHVTLYKSAFGDEKSRYDHRFMYNIFHIIIYYANGMMVSDDFVKIQIDNYLTSKYLDYRLNYYQKKNLKTKLTQASTQLFPNVSPPPDISKIPGGAQFQKDIRLKKKLRKPTELQEQSSQIEDFRMADTSRFPSRIKFDLRQLSPSISTLIHSTNVSPKPQVVTHQVMSNNLNNFNITKALKNLQHQRSQSVQTRIIQKAKSQKILDLYKITQPPLEYYKKHPKIDHLFKDMLDMKLVLQSSQQQMSQQIRIKEDGTSIRQRIQQLLVEKDMQIPNTQVNVKMTALKLDENSSSNYNSQILPTTQHTSRRPSGQDIKSTFLEINPKNIGKPPDKDLPPQFKFNPSIPIDNNKFGYEDHRRSYIQKYGKYQDQVPVDQKINDLQLHLKHINYKSAMKNKK